MKFLYTFIILLLFYSKDVFGQYDSLKAKGIYTSNFIIDEVPRNLTYYMPLNYGKLDIYPLLIVLHDNNSNSMSVIKKYNELIHKKADSANCVVMYPDAVNGIWKTNKDKDSLNDRMFVTIMLNFFIQQYHCDASHIYLLGIGKGSEIAYQFGCERNRKVTAIASVNKMNVERSEPICADKKDLPILNIANEGNIKAAIGEACDFLLSQKK